MTDNIYELLYTVLVAGTFFFACFGGYKIFKK